MTEFGTVVVNTWPFYMRSMVVACFWPCSVRSANRKERHLRVPKFSTFGGELNSGDEKDEEVLREYRMDWQLILKRVEIRSVKWWTKSINDRISATMNDDLISVCVLIFK